MSQKALESLEYGELRKELLRIGGLIISEIKDKGVTTTLLNFEEDLEKTFLCFKNVNISASDTNFINYNYFGPKTYLLIAKKDIFKAVVSFSQAIKNLVEHSNNVTKISSLMASLKYYYSLSNHLTSFGIELFGGTINNNVRDFFDSLNRILSVKSKYDKFQEEIEALTGHFVFKVVTSLKECYSNSHISTAEALELIIENFKCSDNLAKGLKTASQFVLSKKKLHFWVRQLVPKDGMEEADNSETIYENISKIVETMEFLANEEIKAFKKAFKENENPDIKFKKFLSEIDVLSVAYYKALWVDKDLNLTFKKIGLIFGAIRRNWQLIPTPSMFLHFVEEFVFLSNYFKLLLLEEDFRNFWEKMAQKSWQKEVSQTVEKNLCRLREQFFKYTHEDSKDRELLVVEEASSGKFVEFIIFYLIREIIEKKIKLAGFIGNFQKQEMKEIFNIIDNVEDKNDIEWNYPLKNTDVDILIEKKYGLFIKTGILGGSDRASISKEIEVAKEHRIKKIFQMFEIAKNLDTVKKICEDKNIIIVDVGEFLNELLKIAYQRDEISLKLSKNSIFSWAGFYTGG